MKVIVTFFSKAVLVAMILLAVQFASAQDNIEGTFYFSHQPFGETSTGGNADLKRFSSKEFLYGRLELKNGKTLNDVFTFIQDDKESEGESFLHYDVAINKDGKTIAKPRESDWNHLLLKKEDRNKTYLNFDILPDPAKATSLIGADKAFKYGKTCAPFTWQFLNNKPTEAGIYQVTISFFKKGYNAYGDATNTKNRISTQLEFDFNISDIQALIADKKIAENNVSNNFYTVKSLPPIFKKSQPLADPNLSHAKLKAYIAASSPECQVLKMATSREGYTKPLWVVSTHDNGIPRIKEVAADIVVAYKDKTDGKCYICNVDIRQDYMGGGKYGPIFASRVKGGKIIACGAVK